MDPQEELKGFYDLVVEKCPQGLDGYETNFPVRIGNNDLHAVIFGLPNGMSMEFALFPNIDANDPRARYMRKKLTINAAGKIIRRENNTNLAPEFKTDNEPNFDGITDEEVALAVARAVKQAFQNQAA